MKKIIYLLVLTILSFSCVQDDDFIENIIIDDPSQTISDIEFVQNNFGSLVNSSFIGVVVNENNEKLQGVEITINNEVVYTDSNGVFIFNNVSVYEKFAFIKVKKAGYITGSRSIVPVSNGTNDIQITLLEKNIIGTVSSGEISEVSLPNGAKVEFSGHFIDVEGNPYSGNVDVSLHYLEPNTEATFTKMPGMLFGKRNNGSASAMETYGMLAVDLYSQNGEELNISETSTAVLTFPVSASTPNAPDTIVLWYFDDVNGYWKEQGMATKIGNEYVAEVNHFTWWNCDLPLDFVNVCFSLNGNSPLANYYVEIIRNQTNQMIFSGFTNALGEECGLFPKNEAVTIKVYSDCLVSVLYEEVVGPYSSDTTIAINLPQGTDTLATNLSATIVTCNNQVVNNGYAYVYDNLNSNGYDEFTLVNIANGIIDYTLSYCSGHTYSIIVFDLDSGLSTGVLPLSITGNSIDLGSITVCSSSSGVFQGDLDLVTQADVDSFALFGYEVITGDLDIGGVGSLSDISDLSGLTSITSVEGNLEIGNTSNLINLIGLDNITTVGNDVQLATNNGLESILALNSLTSIGGNLDISLNQWLTSLAGLNNITSLNKLFINYNEELQDLSGLENLTSITTDLYLWNTSLMSLAGLENLITVNNMYIGKDPGGTPTPNQNLSNFCALQNLFTNGTYGVINIANNSYNPTVQNIIVGDCNQ